MRLVIQRVKGASVMINEMVHSSIDSGLLVLLGIEISDGADDITYLTAKLCKLRIFSDENGKMNLDIVETGGEVLLVSQFTLHASTVKGNRPSFIMAARPEQAVPLYEKFIEAVGQLLGRPCRSGVFGADMQVELVNDGPVTIIMDSKNRE